MKITIFANWDKGEVINADKMEKIISDRAQEIIDDECELDGYLEDIPRIEILNMSDKEKKELFEKFNAWAKQRATEICLSDEWEEVEVEV